ncbi:MFS transporter [Neobittarella massiliensis]|uniref:MFS transporter n=1 Tax=Neobittarella massiliensis (ex Bilen et al. 2018) TaxID=2041842 RepID=UPI000CF64978|nr:MFS transporter [Neobittarella massiliensis]
MSTSGTAASRRMTAHYAGLQGTYWMVFCAILSFASVFLLSRDFDNTQIGVVLALANAFGALLQPAVAALADRARRVPLRHIVALVAFITAALSGVLLIIPHTFYITMALFCLVGTLMFVIQPLLNALGFVYEKLGITIDFGIARGVGSVAFAAASYLLGLLVARFGADVLPVTFMALYLLIMVLALAFRAPGRPAAAASPQQAAAVPPQSGGLLHFFKKYPAFTAFMLGCTCVFIFHTMLNNFLLQIVTYMGGAETQFSSALTLAAVLELPAMLLFSRLVKRVRCDTLMRVSLVFFLLKAATLALAGSVAGVYVSQCCQIGAYALFIPASVYYANDLMEEPDKVKGQAVMTVTNTLGGVFGSLLGGWLIDQFGIRIMLYCGVGITLLGVLVSNIFIQRTGRPHQPAADTAA